MKFSESIAGCMAKYARFKGRGTRSEDWWFILFCTLLSWGAPIVDSVYANVLVNHAILTNSYFGGMGIFQIAYGWNSMIVTLVLLLPSITATARSLHDANRSGWRQLLVLTVIGIIPLAW